MFINPKHLNEGNPVKSSGIDSKKLLNEGKNPKIEVINEQNLNWKGLRSQTYVNLHWYKLRS